MKNDYSCGGSTTTVKATSVSVYPSCTTLKVGEWFYGAAATVYPSNATNKTVTWRSGNTAVATVNASSGYIYAKFQGSANIYATAADGSGKSDYLTVTVTSAAVPVNSVELNRMVMSLNIGMTVSLSAPGSPENALLEQQQCRCGNCERRLCFRPRKRHRHHHRHCQRRQR